MPTNIYEYCAFLFLPPLAFSTYFALNLALNYHHMAPASALFLPIILFIFVGFAFCITPTKPLTPIAFIFELTVITVVGLLWDFADLRTPIFVVLLPSGMFIFWVIMFYLFLITKGRKASEMGRLGDIAKGVRVVGKGVGVIAKGVGIMFCDEGDPQEEIQACIMYQLSAFSDLSHMTRYQPHNHLAITEVPYDAQSLKQSLAEFSLEV